MIMRPAFALAFGICLASPGHAQTGVDAAHDQLVEALAAVKAEHMELVQLKEECESDCFKPILVLQAENAGTDEQLCFENPFIQSFRTQDGKTLTGIVTDAVFEAADRRAIPETILIEQEVTAGQRFADRLCAPPAVQANGQTLQIRTKGSAARGLAAVDGAPIGALAGFLWDRPWRTLTEILFGLPDRQMLQIEIRSNPAGATVFLEGEVTRFRTNSVIAVPKELLSQIQVRFNNVSRQVRQCDGSPGNGRLTIVFSCEFTP